MQKSGEDRRKVFDHEFVLDKKEHRITCVDVSDNHIVLGNKGGHLMPYETQYMKVKEKESRTYLEQRKGNS
jgi:hypothetical protein